MAEAAPESNLGGSIQGGVFKTRGSMGKERKMIEENTLYHGDCCSLMKDIPDKSIDLILSDPPFNCLSKSNKEAQWDKEIDLQVLWKQYERIIKDNGAILLFAFGIFDAKLILSNPKLWKTTLIWNKVRKTGFLNAKKMPMRQHENIEVFYKKQPTYNPQMVKCEPHERNHSRGNGSHKETNRNYGKYGKAEDIITDEKYPSSIITFPKGHSKEDWLHPTAKPVPLLQYLIRTYSNEGDLVLDNFAGSGSTCIAAIREKRNFIGKELDKHFFEVANERIKHELREPKLF